MRSLLSRVAPLILMTLGAVLPHAAHPPDARATPVAQWERITNPPPARMKAGIAYDSRRHRMLVFGGCKRFGSISDLWSLDLAPSAAWTELAPWWEGPQYEGCFRREAAYDSLRDEVLIVNPGVYYGGAGDTLAIYAYSFSGTPGWHPLTTTGQGPPKPTFEPITVLDPGEHRLILIFEQIWALALDGPPTWTRLFPTGRGPDLNGVAAALDASHRRVLVNGGGPFGQPFVKATWALDLSGPTHWDSLLVAPIPTGRREHVAIHDPLRNRLIVAGGYSGSELLDAWALDLATGSWSQVTPPVPAIAKRYSASAVYDPQDDAMVIFGGLDWSNYLVETVRLSLASPAWAVDPPTAEPVHNASMVYDDQRRRMLLFGGVGPSENARDRLYSLDMAVEPPRWARIVASGSQPLRRHSHMAAWDPVRHRMFIFGGKVDATVLGDLWFYSEGPSPQWTQVNPTGTPPSARAAGALAYDPPRDRLVLVGGRTDVLDVWELPLSGPTALQWRALVPSGTTPPVRRSMGLMYDPVRDRLLIVGGYNSGSSGQSTYSLEFGGSADGTWGTVAGYKSFYPAVTVLRADTIVIYFDFASTPPLETKQLALAAPQAWTTVEVANATPPGRLDHCGAYDSYGDRLVIFGGQVTPQSDAEHRWLADTYTLSWFKESVAAVDPGATPERPLLGLVAPNPARDEITFALSRPRPGPGAIEILDIRGRRIVQRRLDDSFMGGNVVIRIDRELAPGVYFLRLLGEPGSETRRFCVLR